MKSLETEAEISADGSMKLLSPLPSWLKPGRQQVVLMVADDDGPKKRKRLPEATPEMLAQRKAAFARLRELGGLGDVIPDPSAWQREIRQDRVLPGRD